MAALKKFVSSCILFLLIASPLPAPAASGREQSRSMVMTQYGIVATSQAVASQAGAAVLARGGSAVDAAIAANAALNVIEPMMNGVGGDLFAIIYDAKTKKLYGINASGWAPKNMTVEKVRAMGFVDQIRGHGIVSVTVPGAVAGWDMLRRRFGRLSMAEDMAPAIALADKGIVVTETDADNWRSGTPFVKNPEFARVFLPNGKMPVAGQIFRNPDLAATFRRIGKYGRDGFYKGKTAEAILKLSDSKHGFLQADDLTEFEPEWMDPVSTTYHGWTVWEMPPNGQGIAALSMLNIMEQFPIAEWGHNSLKALHLEIEAKNLAYADLEHYIGDPKASHIPVEALLSKQLAARRAKLITDRAQCNTVLPSELNQQLLGLSSETTYLATVDHQGNEVSFIESNSGGFGSGLVPSGTGFVLQDRAEGFTLRPGQPNTLRPRMRPLHTIIPGFMQKGDEQIAFGIMGGFNQAQAHAQFVSNIVDFHMNIQAALGAARFTKPDFGGCQVIVENGVAQDIVEGLRKQGYDITVHLRYSQAMGRGNAVERNHQTGVNYGASDPRTDGEAIPEQPPF